MPINYTSRNIVAGGASPYIPLITNNPAFQVEIVPLDGRLEQKPGQKSDAAQQKAIKIGDTIRGEIVSHTKKSGDRVMGKVLAIEIDNGSITGYKVMTVRGKEVLVDPSTAVKIDLHGEDPVPTSAPQTQLESYQPIERVKMYEEWRFAHLTNDRAKSS
jgi:hypothetical protein